METGELAERLRSGMASMAPQFAEMGVVFAELGIEFGKFSATLATFVHKESHVARCKHPDCLMASLPYREYCFLHEDYTRQPSFYVFSTEEITAQFLVDMASVNVHPSFEELVDTEIPYPAAGGWPLVFEDSLPKCWREVYQEGGDIRMCEAEEKDAVGGDEAAEVVEETAEVEETEEVEAAEEVEETAGEEE
ncbi:MAG: hypothetical protein WC479_12330 [Candidatus Izemoplasmatales bacterium]